VIFSNFFTFQYSGTFEKIPSGFKDFHANFSVMSIHKKLIPMICAITILLGCTHAQFFASSDEQKQVFQQASGMIDLTIDRASVVHEIQRIKTILSKPSMIESEMGEVERFYAFYRAVKLLESSQRIRIESHSKTLIDLQSFCLNLAGQIPSANERYEWKDQSSGGIPYYKEILQFAQKNPDYGQQEIQTLIWNLKNKTNYENYPPRLRSVLDQIDPNAKFKLPSEIKESVIDEGRSLLPPQINDAISMIQGRYYSFEELTALLRQSEPVPNEPQTLSIVPEKYPLYSSSVSEGYSTQRVTFYNPTNAPVEINPTKYILFPVRKEVQPIGISAQTTLGQGLSELIESALKDTIIRNAKYWYQGDLNPSEQALLEEYPLEALDGYIQSREAIALTWLHFGRNDGDDESDAFRHFMWAGFMTKELGDSLALQFLNAHEDIPNPSDKEIASSEMDRYNNGKGIQAELVLESQGKSSRGNLVDRAFEALKNGELNVINKVGGPVYPGH
jgi:hypothetical protein